MILSHLYLSTVVLCYVSLSLVRSDPVLVVVPQKDIPNDSQTDPFATYLHLDVNKKTKKKHLNPHSFRLPSNGGLDLARVRQLVRDMFFHSWKGYLKFAYPHDELTPLSCSHRNVQGGLYITLIDAADTLAVMGEWKEFESAVSMIESIPNFDLDINVSVFETTIRVLGGLLSTHIIATRKIPKYSGRLLPLAQDLGDRLIRSFNQSASPVPNGSVNLKNNNFRFHDSICTSCALSLSLEFGYLSHLTRNYTYMRFVKGAADELWSHRSSANLLGRQYYPFSRTWTDSGSGIAGEIDSYYEYFLKTYLVFHDPFWYTMFVDAYNAVEEYVLQDHGYRVPVDMNTKHVWESTISSLQAFWGGLQVLLGDLFKASNLLERFTQIAGAVRFLPESIRVYTDTNHQTSLHFTEYMFWIQRPEMIESMMYMYRATKDPGIVEAAFEFVTNIMDHTRTECGFAGVHNVKTMQLQDNQESFFLAETLKYLYLLFDPTNPFHDLEWVFTTEAHPLPILPIYQRKPAKPKPGVKKTDKQNDPDIKDKPDATTHSTKKPEPEPKDPQPSTSKDQPEPKDPQPITSKDQPDLKKPQVDDPKPTVGGRKEPIVRHLTRKRTWADQQCDVFEWRVVQLYYSLAPHNSPRSWFRLWGHGLLQ